MPLPVKWLSNLPFGVVSLTPNGLLINDVTFDSTKSDRAIAFREAMEKQNTITPDILLLDLASFVNKQPTSHGHKNISCNMSILCEIPSDACLSSPLSVTP